MYSPELRDLSSYATVCTWGAGMLGLQACVALPACLRGCLALNSGPHAKQALLSTETFSQPPTCFDF